MKKNNSYLADNEIALGDFIKSLWRDKILILSIIIICGSLGYFYALSKPQIIEKVIKINTIPEQLLEPYFLPVENQYKNINNKVNINFILQFKFNFLSSQNIEFFFEQSSEFDNFKAHLKLRNIPIKQYFSDPKFGQREKSNRIIENEYFLKHGKELDGDIFMNEYAEFTKKKTVADLKYLLKLSIINQINNHQEALEIAKKIQLENPILKTINQSQVITEPEALFYKGSKVLEQNIVYLNKKLIELENEQFNFNMVFDKAYNPSITQKNNINFMLYGLFFGFFFSIIIKVFLKH